MRNEVVSRTVSVTVVALLVLLGGAVDTNAQVASCPGRIRFVGTVISAPGESECEGGCTSLWARIEEILALDDPRGTVGDLVGQMAIVYWWKCSDCPYIDSGLRQGDRVEVMAGLGGNIGPWEMHVDYCWQGPGRVFEGGYIRKLGAQPPVINFRADRTSLKTGECTTLRWDVEHVQAVYLDGEGVAGHDTRQVCPAQTTEYTLRVVTADGDVYQTVTITVTPACVPGWECKDASHKAYQNADCSWKSVTYCEHGCQNRECIISSFSIDALEISPKRDRYYQQDPVTIEVEVTNSGVVGNSAMLVVEWKGAILEGSEIGKREITLGPQASKKERFSWMIPSESGTISIVAGIEGKSAQISIQAGPVVPPPPDYMFEFLPSEENATELRVTTPDGMVYVFPIKKVRVNIDTHGSLKFRQVSRIVVSSRHERYAYCD